MSKSGFSLNDKKSKFSLIVEQRFTNTSSKPILIGEVSRHCVELSCLDEERLITPSHVQLLHEQLSSKNRDLREAHEKSLNETEELKRFQGSTFDEFSRRRLTEDRDTILELTAKIQELQNEVNCMNDSRDFKGAESVRSGQSRVTSQPVSFPPHPDPGGMLSRSLGMPSRKKRTAKHLGHTWCIGKRFCKSNSVFFSTLSAGIESMELSYIRTNSLITCGEE